MNLGPICLLADSINSILSEKAPPAGQERSARSPGTNGVVSRSEAQPEAVSEKLATGDSRLDELVVAWPELPDATRKAILAVFEASRS